MSAETVEPPVPFKPPVSEIRQPRGPAEATERGEAEHVSPWPGTGELAREIARARRTGQPMVVAFIDVNGLKSINGSLRFPRDRAQTHTLVLPLAGGDVRVLLTRGIPDGVGEGGVS